jgi:excisionase family DNA binding protein
MPRTSKTANKRPAPSSEAARMNGPAPEVLTLAEAAAYLRLSEHQVLQFVREQGLPARHLGGEWRLLKSAIQDWLRASPPRSNQEAWLALAGAWKDDPFREEMLREIYRQRGRPMTEADS